MLAFSVNTCFANAPISRAINFDSFSAPRGGQSSHRNPGPKERKPSVTDTRMGVGSSVHSVGLIAHSPSPRASVASCRRPSSLSTSTSSDSTAPEWPPVSVDVVSYYIHTCSSPYVLYRLIVTDNKGTQTNVHRRYNDFVELHMTLVKTFPLALPQAMSLPPKRYIKRRKFDPLHMEQRREALDHYVKAMLAVPDLATSPTVSAFLGDHWKRSAPSSPPVAAATEHLLLPPPSPPQRVAQPIPTQPNGRTLQPSPALCSCSPLGPPDRKPHIHPPARPRSPSVRKRQPRKMPLPLEIEVGTSYVACNRRILELRREYDTERPYSHHGTPPRPESYFNKNPKQLARPPAGFFDTVFPTPQMISKQQAFLKEFYRKRWGQVMPHGLTPSP